MPPSTSNAQSGISTPTPDTAAASDARDDGNASNLRATLVTQSQTPTEEGNNAVGAVFGDDLSDTSSEDNTLDGVTRLGRRAHLDNNPPPSVVAFNNLSTLDPPDSTEGNNNCTPPDIVAKYQKHT